MWSMRRRIASSLVLALVFVASCSASARADEPPELAPGANEAPSAPIDPAITPRVRLRYDLLTDGIVTGSLAALLVTWGIVKKDVVGSTSCVICDGRNGDVNALDDAFRSAFRHGDGAAASTASDILAYGGAPALGAAFTVIAAGRDRRLNEAPANGLLALEAVMVASVVQQGLTAVVRRERPAVHERPVAERQSLSGSSLESFPGGHVLIVMAATSSTATIAHLRGYRFAPYIWPIGSAFGLALTYLRIAADRHYFTDNVVGAGLGLGIGALVPLLFHRPVKADTNASTLSRPMLTTTEVAGGRVVNVGWLF